MIALLSETVTIVFRVCAKIEDDRYIADALSVEPVLSIYGQVFKNIFLSFYGDFCIFAKHINLSGLKRFAKYPFSAIKETMLVYRLRN